MTDVTPLDPAQLAEADARLARTVDALSEEELAAPSLLPGWSRAHVVAHVALNGEALEGVLTGLRDGAPRPMYVSNEARDADIEELARATAAELRERLVAAAARFSRAVAQMPAERWHDAFERTPGGQVVRVVNVPMMRLREVEIHHADLGAGYTAADWPTEFSVVLVESMTKREHPEPFRVRARDVDREWQLGPTAGGPLVTGDAGALGWWLTGRAAGAGLESESGSLPRIEPW